MKRAVGVAFLAAILASPFIATSMLNALKCTQTYKVDLLGVRSLS
ncbi:MAG TPA: hypothetical protein VK487_08320 [Candidatus Bathyarchaeia archaeon]|nr:hypothetical protein [Candidatus Bathyarchaeia archaeon]